MGDMAKHSPARQGQRPTPGVRALTMSTFHLWTRDDFEQQTYCLACRALWPEGREPCAVCDDSGNRLAAHVLEHACPYGTCRGYLVPVDRPGRGG